MSVYLKRCVVDKLIEQEAARRNGSEAEMRVASRNELSTVRSRVRESLAPQSQALVDCISDDNWLDWFGRVLHDHPGSASELAEAFLILHAKGRRLCHTKFHEDAHRCWSTRGDRSDIAKRLDEKLGHRHEYAILRASYWFGFHEYKEDGDVLVAVPVTQTATCKLMLFSTTFTVERRPARGCRYRVWSVL